MNTVTTEEKFTPAVGGARRTLAARGPLTPNKLRAAEMFHKMAEVEPWWFAWIIADVSVGLVAMLGAFTPEPVVRGAIVLYAIAYFVSLKYLSEQQQVWKVLVEAAPENFEDTASSPEKRRAVSTITAGAILILGIIIASLPMTAIMIIGGTYFFLMLMHAWNRISAHVRAKQAIREAVDAPWMAQYQEDKAERARKAAEILSRT